MNIDIDALSREKSAAFNEYQRITQAIEEARTPGEKLAMHGDWVIAKNRFSRAFDAYSEALLRSERKVRV